MLQGPLHRAPALTLGLVVVVAGCGRLNYDTHDAMAFGDGGPDAATDSGLDAASDANMDGGLEDAGADGGVTPDRCEESTAREVYCVPDIAIAVCCAHVAPTVYQAIDEIEAAPAGTPALIIVRSGTYASQPRIIRQPTIIRGYDDGSGRPVLSGSNAPVFNLRANEVTIEGIEISGVAGGGPGLISVIQDPVPLALRGDITIRNNCLRSPNESGIYIGLGPMTTPFQNVHITNNIIEDTPRFTLYMADITRIEDVTVTDNCFLSPSGLGVDVRFDGVDLTNNYWSNAAGPGPAGVSYAGRGPTTPFRSVCHLR